MQTEAGVALRPVNSVVRRLDEEFQTPTNSSVGAIDQRIRSRSLEAVSCQPNRDDRRVCVIT